MAGAGLVGGDSDSSELTEGEGDDDVSARVGSVFTTTEGGEDGEEMEGGEDDAGKEPITSSLTSFFAKGTVQGPSTKTRSKKAASGTSQRGKKKSSAGASSSTRAKTASTQAKKKKKVIRNSLCFSSEKLTAIIVFSAKSQKYILSLCNCRMSC
jgi:hypothetical protein